MIGVGCGESECEYGGGGRCLRAIYLCGRVCGRSGQTAAHALPAHTLTLIILALSFRSSTSPRPSARSRPTCCAKTPS